MLLDIIYRALDQSYCVAVVFLDYSKAFDTINHKILINKLSTMYNFSSSACDLLLNYLTNRTIKMSLEDYTSKPTSVNTGVPQGSILGPLLFSLYVNDLPLHLDDSTIPIMYVDDTTLIVISKSFSGLQRNINYII